MKKILIVLNDAILLSVFKSWVFRSQKKDSLLLAKDGKEAIEMMKSHVIELLITELSLPEIDGLELAAGISLHYPEIKIAFFANSRSDTINARLRMLTSLYFIMKPASLREFTHLISVIEVADFQARSLKKMLIGEFLQLIEVQKKTCLLAIENPLTGQKGLIYFEHGVVYDAVYNDFKAELAVVEILSWTEVKVFFKDLAKKQFRRQVHTPLHTLIQDGSQIKATEAKKEMLAKLEEDVQKIAEQHAKERAEQAKALAEQEHQAKILAAEAELAAKIEAEKIKLKAEQDKIAVQMAAKLKAEQAALEAEQAKVAAQLQILSSKISHLDLDLHSLQELDDYLACAIFDMSGKLLVKHNIATSTHNIEEISVNAVEMIKAALETMRDLKLGGFNFLQISTDEGVFEATWVIENQFIAAVLLTPEAKTTGLAKIHLVKIGEFIRSQLLSSVA